MKKSSPKTVGPKNSRVIDFVNLAGARSGISRKHALALGHKLFFHFRAHERLKRACVGHPRERAAELTLVFLGTKQARALNREFRNKDYATDVLSFSPAQRGAGLGELVFCVPVLRRQAREHGLSLRRELDYLLIHGFLHLLGYDHEKSRREEVRMMNLQDRLFEKFNAKT